MSGMAPTSSQPSNIVPQKTACMEALGTKKVAKPSQLTKASTSTGDHKMGWFPKVFAHINSQQELPSQSQKDKAALQPDWQVLNCSQGYNFSVIQESFPTGQTLSTFKGHAKAGTSDSHLWLGTGDEGDNSTGEVQSLDEDQSSSEDLIYLSSSFTDLGFDKSGTGNIPMLLLHLTNAGIPKVTLVLDAIEVSESDQFLWGVILYDDKKAPHMTSAWDEDFAFMPKLKDHDISDLCGL
ncbi:hypothetical protein EDC04DRAFT_2606545 [Pisolithus marmoratus]|nr:hypothetical protein EDC04DRAFT_2606545 [Pisolithus marmoratus]